MENKTEQRVGSVGGKVEGTGSKTFWGARKIIEKVESDMVRGME
jgi:hypothetical protein